MIYLCQILCHQKHTLLAAPRLAENIKDVELWFLPLWRYATEHRGFKCQCGICGSTALVADIRESKFKDMGEALEVLQDRENRNLVLRRMMDVAGVTYQIRQVVLGSTDRVKVSPATITLN